MFKRWILVEEAVTQEGIFVKKSQIWMCEDQDAAGSLTNILRDEAKAAWADVEGHTHISMEGEETYGE